MFTCGLPKITLPQGWDCSERSEHQGHASEVEGHASEGQGRASGTRSQVSEDQTPVFFINFSICSSWMFFIYLNLKNIALNILSWFLRFFQQPHKFEDRVPRSVTFWAGVLEWVRPSKWSVVLDGCRWGEEISVGRGGQQMDFENYFQGQINLQAWRDH